MVQLSKLKEVALANQIPIMRADALDYLVKIIKDNKYQTILEIGTATGYSALYLQIHTGVKITTIEKDYDRYQEALINTMDNNRIEVIYGDALEILISSKYDVIIIDAAKSKNQALFEKYHTYLNGGGIIVTDNLNLDCLNNKIMTKNRQKLLDKTRDYIDYLKKHPIYITEFIDVGDKIAVSRRRE